MWTACRDSLRVPMAFGRKRSRVDLYSVLGHTRFTARRVSAALIARRRRAPRGAGGGRRSGARPCAPGRRTRLGIAGFAAAAEWMLALPGTRARRCARRRLRPICAACAAAVPNLRVNGPDPAAKGRGAAHPEPVRSACAARCCCTRWKPEGVYVGNGVRVFVAEARNERRVSGDGRTEKQDAETAVRFSLGMMNTT